eukprot:TRINITY_DN5471_c0_g1_i2.p1 TRINITY_DN5471_c0_g1~~TRINITY_DN5471_c0_g1_i2.p1  ORF type:complete len:1139 (-),score=92.24 TRINITY_DN5471_c0_g1_i2:303-3719(-)
MDSTKKVRFLTYNVNGLLSKLENTTIIQSILDHDFICLTETFIATNFESDKFNDYSIYVSKAKKLSHHGRYSGGVIVLVHKEYEPYVEQINVNAENMIVLKIDKSLFATSKDIMYISCYIPPTDSAYWQTSQDGYGIECLDQSLLDLFNSHEDFYILLNGDLNARTAAQNYSFSSNELDDMSVNENTQIPRISQDNGTNMFGDQLIELCNMYDCTILNGLCDGEFDGGFTYIASTGASVVDYFIMSCDLLLSESKITLEIVDSVESDHLPVTLSIEANDHSGINDNKKKHEHIRCYEKHSWDDGKEHEFIQYWKSSEIQGKLQQATTDMNNNVDKAVLTFVECLKSASKCMLTKCYGQKKIRKNEWFDSECVLAKKETRQKLRMFRTTRDDKDRKEFIRTKQKYKYILKRKARTFRREKIAQLENNVKNTSRFWKDLKSMGCGKQKTVNNNSIDINEWCDHFKSVFKTNEIDQYESRFNEIDITEDFDNILNQDIKEEEVQKAIKKLKSGKSCGLDGISAEMLKAGAHEVINFLTKLFNVLFNKGIYPKDWAKAIIIPIHKKGDTNQANNYRGVSLLSVISKCYSSILNARLYNWLEANSKISENQAGFRKNYSTVDHIFSLYSIVQKCMCKKGQKLYVAFVDFQKAFDSVRHDKLLDCLRNQGIKGKFFVSLRAMYTCLLSCVRANADYSDFFQCPSGVRQGCVLSPTLFSIFINQLSDHITEKGRHGIHLMPDIMELFILLFADDVALISTTPVGLQNQLNCLKTCSESMALNLNKNKTKVMVFRKGGYLAKHEEWFYDGTKLEVVNNYCYLGYNFTTKLSLKKGTDHLVTKGKKAVMLLNRTFSKYKEMTDKTYFIIFDAKIKSILLYSSEIWGYQRLDSIEKVHLMACKRFLGVPSRTPNKMVYGDLGRYPIFVNSLVSCIRYWIRLLNMEQNRIPKMAYLMLLSLDSGGKDCWVTKIRDILCETGFAFVWLQQSVGNVNGFIKAFRQRIIDVFIQEWSSSVRDRDRYESYRSFKVIFEREKYLSFLDTYCFRVAMTQTRFGVLPLNNNLHRFSQTSSDRCCPVCVSKTEDERHFLFECPLYTELRDHFLQEMPTVSLELLLKSKNETHCRCLTKFVFHAVSKRKRFFGSEQLA